MAKPWTLAMLGLVALGALVWFAGPLLVVGGGAPLASPGARLLVIAVLALGYAAQKLWQSSQARRTNEHVVSALVASSEPGAIGEAGQLRERFATALAQLRRARFGARGGSFSSLSWKFSRAYLYQLPWYVIIGAPGAGKTTALLNSGLEFPLRETLGRGAVRGVGGTRHYDWWFTDRAVLIDTAGRYTTHESDRVADRQAWGVFLELLRRSRPRRPLNGVLVAVSVVDLLELSVDGLIEHARLLRTRLDELQLTLRVRLPVYLLLTKCDLLPGFIDWFGTLERRDREQPWGVTFDLRASDSAQAAAEFAAEFELLVDRLAGGLAARLETERDAQRRARIFTLARQLRALAEPLDTLVRRALGPGRVAAGAAAPCLRGVYLTSGTQHGTPIDRMLSAFGRELGLERQILPPHQSTGKSFFLTRLLREVLPAEAELSGRSPLRQRARRRLRLAAFAVLQLFAVVVATWWVSSYFGSVDEFARLDGGVSRVRAVVDAMPTRAGPDPRALLPVLDATGALARAVPGRGWTGIGDIGARARDKLRAAAAQAYDRMLLGPFQGRIVRAIDASLRTGADVNVQYEALKAYAMLTEPAHFSGSGLRVFVMSYWGSKLAPPLSPGEHVALAGHLDALIRAGAVGSGISVEPALVASVRSRLQGRSPPERILLRLTVLPDSPAHEDFTVASLGPDAAAIFVGPDGHSAPAPVPGRYTMAAYRELIVARAPEIAAQLASEAAWVLETPAAAEDAAAVAGFMDEYRRSYARAWADLLDGVRLKPAASNAEAIREARLLGASDGPLALLIDAIVRETAPAPEGTEGPIAPGDALAARALGLQRLLAPDASGGAPLDLALETFRELATLRGAAVGGATHERLAHVLERAAREPEPVHTMLLALAVLPTNAVPADGSAAASPAALSRQIAARLGVECLRLVAGHFPFERSALRDASIEDFSRLFAPRGGFATVFAQLVAPHVDASSDTWQPRGAGVAPATEELERFRSAARIRQVFFPQGGTQPAIQLTFRPLEMDAAIDRFQLEVDDQLVRYAHGPPVATTLRWPGTHGSARIDTTPATEGELLEFNGPWALFRLLDHAAVQEAGSPGTVRVVFDVGSGRHVSFEVQSDSGANPFRLRELEHFDCPLPGS